MKIYKSKHNRPDGIPENELKRLYFMVRMSDNSGPMSILVVTLPKIEPTDEIMHKLSIVIDYLPVKDYDYCKELLKMAELLVIPSGGYAEVIDPDGELTVNLVEDDEDEDEESDEE